MDRRGRRAIAGAVGLLSLIGDGSVGLADLLDARLAGAWATSEADCARLFQRRGRALTFRQPVDKFAQAATIGPQTILALSSSSRVQSVSREKGDQSERRVQRLDQLPAGVGFDQSSAERRDRLQPDWRSRASASTSILCRQARRLRIIVLCWLPPCALRPSTAAHSNSPHRGRSQTECTDSNSGRPRGSC